LYARVGGVASVVAFALLAGCASGRALDAQRVDSSLLGPEAADPRSPSELSDAISRVDTELSTAPTDAVSLAGALFCGAIDRRRSPSAVISDISTETECLLDAESRHAPAVLVQLETTIEGEEYVTVWRALSDGSAVAFLQASHHWSLVRCRSLSDAGTELRCEQ
jgi:hypothetical protein